MVDICDFATGLSAPALRPVDALRAPRPPHAGAVAPARPVGIVTAFNFRWPSGRGIRPSPPPAGEYDGLEAFAARAADRHRDPAHLQRVMADHGLSGIFQF